MSVIGDDKTFLEIGLMKYPIDIRNSVYNVVFRFPADKNILVFTKRLQENGEYLWEATHSLYTRFKQLLKYRKIEDDRLNCLLDGFLDFADMPSRVAGIEKMICRAYGMIITGHEYFDATDAILLTEDQVLSYIDIIKDYNGVLKFNDETVVPTNKMKSMIRALHQVNNSLRILNTIFNFTDDLSFYSEVAYSHMKWPDVPIVKAEINNLWRSVVGEYDTPLDKPNMSFDEFIHKMKVAVTDKRDRLMKELVDSNLEVVLTEEN